MQLTPLRRGAKSGQQQALPHLSHPAPALFALLDLWERRHLSQGVLRDNTGDIKLDKLFAVFAASAALAQGRSNLASRCTFSSWSPSSKVFCEFARISQFVKKSETPSQSSR